MEQAKRRIPTETADVVLGQLADQYLRGQVGSPQTAAIRRQALRHLQFFLEKQGRKRLADITGADLEAWRLNLQERDFAPASLEIFCRSARQFFKWLEQEQQVFISPAAGFIVPRPPRPALRVLTPEQVQRLLSQPALGTPIGLRDRVLLVLAYATGLTAYEMCSLQHQDVSRELVKVRGRKPRTLPLDGPAAEALTRYLDQARPRLAGQNHLPALWLTLRGTPLTRPTLQQVFTRHSKAAGLGYITPAALRRACAAHRLQAGEHPLHLQTVLGHANLRTLCQYLRLTTTELFNDYQRNHHATGASA